MQPEWTGADRGNVSTGEATGHPNCWDTFASRLGLTGLMKRRTIWDECKRLISFTRIASRWQRHWQAGQYTDSTKGDEDMLKVDSPDC
jgi:hypothetical protein